MIAQVRCPAPERSASRRHVKGPRGDCYENNGDRAAHAPSTAIRHRLCQRAGSVAERARTGVNIWPLRTGGSAVLGRNGRARDHYLQQRALRIAPRAAGAAEARRGRVEARGAPGVNRGARLSPLVPLPCLSVCMLLRCEAGESQSALAPAPIAGSRRGDELGRTIARGRGHGGAP